MKNIPPDEEEERRARDIAEQCWLGPLCLLLWVIIILACIHGCVKGAECRITWDMPAAAEQVTHWKIYRGLDLLATVESPPAVLDLPTDARSTLAVVAVNAAGTSPPATIEVMPVSPQWSREMRVWIVPQRTFFIEPKDRAFFRFTYPTP